MPICEELSPVLNLGRVGLYFRFEPLTTRQYLSPALLCKISQLEHVRRGQVVTQILDLRLNLLDCVHLPLCTLLERQRLLLQKTGTDGFSQDLYCLQGWSRQFLNRLVEQITGEDFGVQRNLGRGRVGLQRVEQAVPVGRAGITDKVGVDFV